MATRTTPAAEPVEPVEPVEAAANEVMGEDELRLGKRTYVLRPSYDAVKAIETRTGATLLQLYNDGNRGAIPLERLGVIAAELINAHPEQLKGGRVDADRIAQLIYRQGLPGVTARLTLLMLDAATGGRDLSGERVTVVETADSPTGS